ncbi:uncharacterized protein LOC117565930 isoform X1 [Drosophila albomicans]|uniref:Uncharacterized protein LOC117565930 isoform X1 n=2 Tax=Drosophila albomicans TaxID=7291 RepID=A0A6P8WSF7_DROAB|nr:uncharacterized protein LOC117565930 isoform X1 [Drosophila albomicans]
MIHFNFGAASATQTRRHTADINNTYTCIRIKQLTFYRLLLFTMDSSLLILNGDCLDNVFQFFSLDELMVIFGEVHPFIDDAIHRQLHRFRDFEFSMRFPPQYNEEQLKTLGGHLRSLNVNVGYSTRSVDVLKLLHQLFIGAKESGRLQALKIQHTNFTNPYMTIIMPVASTLRELDLGRCDIEDYNQLMLLLQSATNLEILALYNKDIACLDESVLNRLRSLKINWLVGTAMFDVSEISRKHPLLSIKVYHFDNVDVYGPPLIGKTGYFH